ncbi:O-antigen ligase family protein [Microvirga terricola]|uniref:O-antigen ligase family protein n=1 Tax=Microvirga terricola TaxID=2719797 RepID=A0ABX0VEM4_9HYPH|nr:O-antigen ligase family protein [Microvirga terricola]NIX78082.1 O-antigen ligase family protein [Microvirga terricola]
MPSAFDQRGIVNFPTGAAGRSLYCAKAAYLCLGITVVLIWFPEPLALPGGMSVVTPFMAVAVCIAFRGARLRAYPVLDRASTRFVAVALASSAFVLFWSNISILNAPEPLRSGRVIVTHFSGAALLVLLYATFTVERARNLVGLLLILASVISALSFVAYFNSTLFAILFADRDRSNGFFKHANQYGMVLSTVAPVGLALALSSQRRLWWLAITAATAFGFIAAGSKTNLLIFAASSSLLLLFAPLLEEEAARSVFNFFRNLGIGIGVAIIGFASLISFNPRAVRLLTQFFSDEAEVKSLLSRKALWDYSFEQFYNNPIFGQGAGQMLNVDFGDGPVPHSHNVIIDYMRMLGVPGLAVCLIFLTAAIIVLCSTIMLAYRAKNASHSDRMMAVGLALGGLAYIAANMSSDSFGPSTSPFFWLVTYLALFMRTVLSRDSRARSVRRPRIPDGRHRVSQISASKTYQQRSPSL